jgi:hypothetical protein
MRRKPPTLDDPIGIRKILTLIGKSKGEWHQLVRERKAPQPLKSPTGRTTATSSRREIMEWLEEYFPSPWEQASTDEGKTSARTDDANEGVVKDEPPGEREAETSSDR